MLVSGRLATLSWLDFTHSAGPLMQTYRPMDGLPYPKLIADSFSIFLPRLLQSSPPSRPAPPSLPSPPFPLPSLTLQSCCVSLSLHATPTLAYMRKDAEVCGHGVWVWVLGRVAKSEKGLGKRRTATATAHRRCTTCLGHLVHISIHRDH